MGREADVVARLRVERRRPSPSPLGDKGQLHRAAQARDGRGMPRLVAASHGPVRWHSADAEEAAPDAKVPLVIDRGAGVGRADAAAVAKGKAGEAGAARSHRPGATRPPLWQLARADDQVAKRRASDRVDVHAHPHAPRARDAEQPVCAGGKRQASTLRRQRPKVEPLEGVGGVAAVAGGPRSPAAKRELRGERRSTHGKLPTNGQSRREVKKI